MACDSNTTGYCNAVRAVARYANQPREVHWSTAIGILGYVFSTSDFGTTFQKGCGLELIAFAGADYASKATDRRSVSGGATKCLREHVCASFRETGNASRSQPLIPSMQHWQTPIRRRCSCGWCGALFFRGLVQYVLRCSRIMRGRRTWQKTQSARRTRGTSTWTPLIDGTFV